jgi:hypothetical protein
MVDISIFAESIEDVSIVPGGESLDITLSGVDVSQFIEEIGTDVILGEIDKEEILEFLKENDTEEEDE